MNNEQLPEKINFDELQKELDQAVKPGSSDREGAVHDTDSHDLHILYKMHQAEEQAKMHALKNKAIETDRILDGIQEMLNSGEVSGSMPAEELLGFFQDRSKKLWDEYTAQTPEKEKQSPFVAGSETDPVHPCLEGKDIKEVEDVARNIISYKALKSLLSEKLNRKELFPDTSIEATLAEIDKKLEELHKYEKYLGLPSSE